MYQKDQDFVENIRIAIAGMMVRQPGFLCCIRGTTAGGLPIADAGATLLTVPDTPWLALINPVKMILTEYLATSNVNGNTTEEIMNYTFENNNGIFKAFYPRSGTQDF